jgi:pentatricopeptide repeat protein
MGRAGGVASSAARCCILPPHRLSAAAAAMPPPAAPATNRVALYLRRARFIDSLRVRLRSSSPSSPPALPPDDPVVALHAIRAAPTASCALSLFRALPSQPPPPLPLYQALAARLSSLAALSDLRAHLASFPLPAPPLARLRLLAAAGDRASALEAFGSLPATPRRPAEAHNVVIELHARGGDHDAAVEAFRRMVREGALPNARTYTVVIAHLASAGFVDQALEVFRILPSLRVRRTTRQYNVLAEALASGGRFDQLRWLVREMAAVDGVMPGPQMRAAIAALREAGHVDGTKDFVEELSPNARIGYAVDDVEGEGDGEEEDDDEEDEGEVKDRGNGEKQTLKPWLDPRELARALDGWDSREVAELEGAGLVWTPRLVCKLLRAFKKAETAWEFFCWVACRPGGFAHDRHTVARMMAILARTGHVELVERLLAKVRADGILLPLATVRLVIDFYGLSKKADAAVRVFQEAESICGPISGPNLALLYSSLLRTMTKCRRGPDAMDLLEEMMARGVLPDLQTFSGLMEHLAGAGDLKGVHRLLGLVRQCELQPDGYMYSVLVRAYCKRERAALALRVFDEMRAAGVTPDAPTKALLVKSLWREGKLREAALVEERCNDVVDGLPDVSPGHVWTASAADLKKVLDIYSGCLDQPAAQTSTG